MAVVNETYEINTSLVKDMSIGDVLSIAYKVKKAGGSEKAGIDRELALAALYVNNRICQYRFSNEGLKLSVEWFWKMHRIASDDFIQIHRLNYLAYRYVQDFSGELDDKKLLNFNTKRYWKMLDAVFQKYKQAHKTKNDAASWRAIDDYTRLVYNFVHPLFEPLENAVRDYLIRNRNQIWACAQKDDIPLLTKTYVALILFAGLRNTRRNFFTHQYDDHGFDLSADFRWANVDMMCNHFVSMMETFGIKFAKDKDGDMVPKGVDAAQSARVDSCWSRIVNVLTDEELMDEKALEAINLNPSVKADYERIVAEQEAEDLKEAMEGLKQAYNVSSL